MKIVITLPSVIQRKNSPNFTFGSAIQDLLEEGHQLVVVLSSSADDFKKTGTNGKSTTIGQLVSPTCPLAEAAMIGTVVRDHQAFVSSLAMSGIPAIGLHGSDGHIIRTRRRQTVGNTQASTPEIATVDLGWIKSICGIGGVPVILNSVFGSEGKHYWLDAHEIASTFAIEWRANAMIVLTETPGVKKPDGSIVRWLAVEEIDKLAQHITGCDELISQLCACKRAAKGGVFRVRMLPISYVDTLRSFYSSRIEYGTEIYL